MKKFATCTLALALCVMGIAKISQVVAGEETTQTLYGQITSAVAEDSKSLSIKNQNGQTQTMNIAQNTKIKNAKGQPGKLSDLEKGNRIECTATKTETANTFNCSEIRIGRVLKGQITFISEDSKSLKMTETGSDKEITMNLSKATRVRLGDEQGKISDLKKGAVECDGVQSTETTVNAYEIRQGR